MDKGSYFLLSLCLILEFYGKYAQGINCQNYTWISLDFSYYSVYTTNTTTQMAGTVETCMTLCVENQSCNAIDFHVGENGSNTCVMFVTPKFTSYSNFPANNYHRKLIRNLNNCGPEKTCTYQWSGSGNYHYFGGFQTSYTKVDDCIVACQNDSLCNAVDWDPSSSQCWFNYNYNPKGEPSTLFTFVKTYNDQAGSTTVLSISSTLPPTNNPNVDPICSRPVVTSPAQVSYTASSAPSVAPSPTIPATTTTASNGSSNATTTTVRAGPANAAASSSDSSSSEAFAIKPAYIVLAGLGAGCVLMVIVAVVTLCQYRLHAGEKVSYNHFTNGHTEAVQAYQPSTMENYQMTETPASIVESNPYFNHDDFNDIDEKSGY